MQDAGENRGKVRREGERERAREEGGNTEGGEKVCDRGRENQMRKRESERGYHAGGRYGYQMQTEMCKEKKKRCVLKYTAGAGAVSINIATC